MNSETTVAQLASYYSVTPERILECIDTIFNTTAVAREKKHVTKPIFVCDHELMSTKDNDYYCSDYSDYMCIITKDKKFAHEPDMHAIPEYVFHSQLALDTDFKKVIYVQHRVFNYHLIGALSFESDKTYNIDETKNCFEGNVAKSKHSTGENMYNGIIDCRYTLEGEVDDIDNEFIITLEHPTGEREEIRINRENNETYDLKLRLLPGNWRHDCYGFYVDSVEFS